MPITRTTGPVTLTLLSLRESGSPQWHYVTPEWRLDTTDPRWSGTKPSSVQFSDATGNDGSLLSPMEPAWSLHTVLHRERPEQFTAAERLVFTNVVLPQAGEFVPHQQAADVVGCTVRVVGTGGPGRLSLTNGLTWGFDPSLASSGGSGSTSDGKTQVEYWTTSASFVFVEVTHLQSTDEVRLVAHDERGRNVSINANNGSHYRQNSLVRMDTIQPSADARSLTIEVFISRPLAFDFMIDPKEIQAAQSGKK